MSSRNSLDAFGDWIQPIQRQNLSETAYTVLRDALMRGQLKPGEKLQLRPISRHFNISVTPMREALFRLIAEKALDMETNGTVVVPSLNVSQLIEIRMIRKLLEGAAAEAASNEIKTHEINKMELIHKQIVDCQKALNYNEAVNLNTEFHLLLCRASRLPITYEMVENLWIRCGPILSHLYDGGVPVGLDATPVHPHLLVIRALKKRDGAAARKAICDDIENGGKHLLAYVAQSI